MAGMMKNLYFCNLAAGGCIGFLTGCHDAYYETRPTVFGPASALAYAYVGTLVAIVPPIGLWVLKRWNDTREDTVKDYQLWQERQERLRRERVRSRQ